MMGVFIPKNHILNSGNKVHDWQKHNEAKVIMRDLPTSVFLPSKVNMFTFEIPEGKYFTLIF